MVHELHHDGAVGVLKAGFPLGLGLNTGRTPACESFLHLSGRARPGPPARGPFGPAGMARFLLLASHVISAHLPFCACAAHRVVARFPVGRAGLARETGARFRGWTGMHRIAASAACRPPAGATPLSPRGSPMPYLSAASSRWCRRRRSAGHRGDGGKRRPCAAHHSRGGQVLPFGRPAGAPAAVLPGRHWRHAGVAPRIEHPPWRRSGRVAQPLRTRARRAPPGLGSSRSGSSG